MAPQPQPSRLSDLWCPRCPAPLVLRSRTAPSGPPHGDVPESLLGSAGKFLPQPALRERNLQGARDRCRGNRTGGKGCEVPGFRAPLGTAVGAALGGRDVHGTFVASSPQGQKVVSWGHCRTLQSTLLDVQGGGKKTSARTLG